MECGIGHVQFSVLLLLHPALLLDLCIFPLVPDFMETYIFNFVCTVIFHYFLSLAQNLLHTVHSCILQFF